MGPPLQKINYLYDRSLVLRVGQQPMRDCFEKFLLVAQAL